MNATDAWGKIRPLLSTIPANLRAEIAILDAHLKAAEHKVEHKVETSVESFVGKVEKVISKVKGS
jgi:hypothetical protein